MSILKKAYLTYKSVEACNSFFYTLLLLDLRGSLIYLTKIRAVKSVFDVLLLGSLFFLRTFGSKVVSATPIVFTYRKQPEQTTQLGGQAKIDG